MPIFQGIRLAQGAELDASTLHILNNFPASPPDGYIFLSTGLGASPPGVHYWNGTTWNLLGAAGGSIQISDVINLQTELNTINTDITSLQNTDTNLQNQINNLLPEYMVISNRTASFTLVAVDNNSYMRVTSATPAIVTVPSHVTMPAPVGYSVVVIQTGAGQVECVGQPGVSIVNAASYDPKTREIGSSLMLVKVDFNAWDVVGDMAVTV